VDNFRGFLKQFVEAAFRIPFLWLLAAFGNHLVTALAIFVPFKLVGIKLENTRGLQEN
jgi:hypothetical protein